MENSENKSKVNNWIENILVFAVIPLVLFLLFLCPSVNDHALPHVGW